MPGPPVDLVDETFVVADRRLLARQISDPALWLEWWPDLRLSVVTDRGVDGIRWSVSGALSGTAEIWLEPWQDGVVVHWFLRAGLPPRGSRDTGLPPRGSRGSGSLTERECARLRHRYATAFKRRIHALKDDLERGRPAGLPRGHG
ncbi:MAG: polyketide cyclase / dehydrase and lipid transport [Jiangellaceae bacterium]|jgi:hypothetical protein